jgi:DNA polymerase-3 subunit delta'
VARAFALLDGAALAVRQRVTNLLNALPQVDAQALHQLGDALGGTDWGPFTAFVDAVNAWLSGRLTLGTPDTARLAKVAETFDTVNREARTVEAFNLDRKPFVFATFGLLAESARR